MTETKVSLKSAGDVLSGRLFTPEGITSDQALPAVLFCHGATDYKEHFFEFCQFLTDKGYVTLALDMHGHGESGGTRYHVSMEYWVQDVMAAVNYLSELDIVDTKRIATFGFSSGGTAVLMAALQNVEIKTLVLLDATVRNVVSKVEAKMLQWISRLGMWKRRKFGSDIHLPLYPFALINPITNNPEISRAFTREAYFKQAYYRYPLPGALESLVVNLLPQLNQITLPTCVIHGEKDKLDSPDTAKLIFDALAGEKQLHIIPDNGHMGHIDFNKKKVMDVTFNWLEKEL
jgi:alpha-beta hydrolase superfamily lysophospholipase